MSQNDKSPSILTGECFALHARYEWRSLRLCREQSAQLYLVLCLHRNERMPAPLEMREKWK